MSIRWRIARALAGPIIRDPIPGPDGCAVIVREGGATAIWTPTKFRIRSRLCLTPRERLLATEGRIFGDYGRSVMTFAGTIVRGRHVA